MTKIISKNPVRACAIMTCFNRRDLTLKCLHDLYRQVLPDNHVLDVIVVDDGSSDGTTEAVRAKYPSVRIIAGNGSLYWSGGMRVAYAAAMEAGYDFYLWLNDDITLDSGALSKMFEIYRDCGDRNGKSPIIIGTFRDPRTRKLNYGGWKSRNRFFPTRMRRLKESTIPQSCDAGNGNCVLIPGKMADVLGNIDPVFIHSTGDFDYTWRASKAGFPVIAMPGTIGECLTNITRSGMQKPNQTILEKWQFMTSVKLLPFRQWGHYHRKHGGPLWVLAFLSPYVKFWLLSPFTNKNAQRVREAGKN